MKTLEKLIASLVIKHPWKTIFTTLVIVGFVGSYMRYVAPSISYKDMLGAEHPKLLEYEALQNEYTQDDNLLVLIEALDGDAFTKDILEAVRELTTDLWQTPFSIRVDSITNFQHSEAFEDDLLVSDLVREDEDLDDGGIENIRSIALSEPLILNRGVNRSGRTFGISVKFAFPNEDMNEKLDAVAFVENLVEGFQKRNTGIQTYIGGLVALDATVMKISQEETGKYLMGVMGIVIVMLIAIFRTVLPIVISVFVFIFTIVGAMAFSGMMGWKLTPFTASVPMIVLILAVADCVHYVTSYIQHIRKGEKKEAAIASALRLNIGPIGLTSITTAIGFLTLNFSESESIAALGNQVAFGVLFALFLSLTFLPAVLRILPGKKYLNTKSKPQKDYGAVVDFLFGNKVKILSVAFVALVGLSYSMRLNEFNDEIPKYFSENLPWRQANDFSEKEFGGAYTFAYSLDTGEAGGVSDPEFLSKADKFVAWLRSQPEAVYVNSITDTVKRLNRNMHADDADYYTLPENKELAAQYVLLYEMSLPYGLDLNDQINLDKSSIRIQIVFSTLSTKGVLEMETRINQWLDSNFSEIEYRGSGVQLMFAHMMSRDVKSLIYGTTMGLFVISLTLIFGFRSLKIGLMSIVPNLFPVFMAFGTWGLLVGQIGMGMSMVSGMTIGIVVDDTIHFLSKYLHGRRELLKNSRDAVAYAFSNVGPSIVITTLVLIAGFFLMAVTAEFRVNSDMGKMTIIVLSFALVLDLLVLPILLMLIDRDRAN
ncbi:MMPL family transporter [Puniceicoccaceae bacterium K14]|nr:MMPL family transporter [Puniceicoccaceae bacterium K14]